ncbi:undecaprenyl-diphosphate phosphatase [Haloarcula marismortui]|uniref:Undecaprenyl-diphosphatase n=1 Tax=Haloarcula marismortui ATCC 33800 TaxID=662476 RepID=M0JSX6_9EURY|nr:undecaprenyl-diphosphate phosphatase [Haloarcula sinaiiensis]EMA12071.1 bacitracin resistance protein [Haloarcula sinaiiensis ATCC 33800]QUJ71302.1 undecaprenyl-diphosphate phosphatase [Haloarcula sinaiiensis ATCC 33800]
MNPILVAILLGLLQGVLEWIPVSSEGGVALASTVVTGVSPAASTRLALFLHAGTAVAATAYYRTEVRTILHSIRQLSRRPFADETADLSFIVIATAATAVTGLPAYMVLDAAVSELEGGLFLALVGGLLVITGLLQRFAAALSLGEREIPDGFDAVMVGVLQGLAILPGVSRSGTTVSALLLRGHEGESSLRLSFLLSIPAALAANVLVLVDDGIPAIEPLPAVVALIVSAVVGYLTVDALVRLVRQVPFWAVCTVFGGLGVVGGLLVAL